MAKITLKNLAHSYNPNPVDDSDYALKALDMSWEDGGAYALLGASGCGKSTLLNIISGLLHPSRGEILFNDEPVTSKNTVERNIAQVFQFPVVYDTMTVRENLAFPLKNRGAKADYIKQRVEVVAQMIDMQHVLDRKAVGLGADDKQKISLGRGMVREDVNAILFDEPLTVIDPHLKWALRTQIKTLREAFGHTMIYVTHDQTEALTFADKVVVMYEGIVVQVGTPEELFNKPAHTFVGYFIGSPGMNILPAEVHDNRLKLGPNQIALTKRYPKLTGKVELGIRPEFISVGHNLDNGMPIVIKRIEDVGRMKIVRGDLNGHHLDIVISEADDIREDMNSVVFAPEGINLYVDDWRVEALS